MLAGLYAPASAILLHRDTRRGTATILRNTASQFITGDADRQEIRDLFGAMPRVSPETVGPQAQFRNIFDFFAQMAWPGIRQMDFVLMETDEENIYWFGVRHQDWLGRTRYVFHVPEPIIYDRNTGVFEASNGRGIFGVAFDYDSEQHMVFASQQPWLAWWGYNVLIDRIVAPMANVQIDTVRVPFYYDGHDWKVQIWRGNYFTGFHGAEFGFYRLAWHCDVLNFSHFEAAEDFLVPMTMDVYHGSNRLFATAGTRWWIAAFQYGQPFGRNRTVVNYQDLRMYGTIEFDSAEMLAAFVESFEENKRDVDMHGEVDGMVFSFVWGPA